MENTAVSEAALRASIVERLNAIHVDITDMSGSSPNDITPSPVASHLAPTLTLVLTLLQAAVARHFQP